MRLVVSASCCEMIDPSDGPGHAGLVFTKLVREWGSDSRRDVRQLLLSCVQLANCHQNGTVLTAVTCVDVNSRFPSSILEPRPASHLSIQEALSVLCDI